MGWGGCGNWGFLLGRGDVGVDLIGGLPGDRKIKK
jgi:hypothetical protein